MANAAVARPHDPPPAVGDGVALFRAVRLHSRHPPVVTRPRGQSLVCEEVPLVQVGDADGRLQGHLLNKDFRQNLMEKSNTDFLSAVATSKLNDKFMMTLKDQSFRVLHN